MNTRNYICGVIIVTVSILIQIVHVCGNVSDYGEECDYSAECIDHRMICTLNENNVSVCECDRFHEWRGNDTGCAQKYNVSSILDMVVFIRDMSEYERSRERTFLIQKVAGYFVLSVCCLTVIAVMSYCYYVRKTDLALKESLKRMKNTSKILKSALNNCKEWKPKKLLNKTIPSINWLSHYQWKESFLNDLISGVTVAIMHIPQGMAYGMLGNVPPIIGMYMAFFPVLIYMFLGTSRHNSLGTFAVVCLMTGKVVLEHADPSYFDAGHANATDSGSNLDPKYTPVQVATAVTFTVSIFQLLMYVFRLGIVSTLLSETLVSGFTTAAAVHVLTSQIKDLFGLTIPRHRGLFVIVNTYVSIFGEIANLNLVAVIVSTITIICSVFSNEVLKPKVAKICSFPIPIELLAIVAGTIASYSLNMHQYYNVKILGNIPSGLPGPAVPKIALVDSILLDSFIIAVVSYTINLSMALIFAQKAGYEVDANQELLAMGAGNMLGSFFSCMPFTASLSRSVLQYTVGGKTQIASLVSCSILVVILMWIGPYFESLPRCVLASVIVVALKGMLLQVKDFMRFWKLSKMDAAVWLVTFLATIFIGIDVGLLAGIVMSLVSIFVLGMKPYTCLLGSVPNTDLYLDINRYKGAEEIPGLKIFHYQGGINFASRNYFKRDLFKMIELNPQKEFIWRRKLVELSENGDDSQEELKLKREKLRNRTNHSIHCLILDFSALSYVDPSGVTLLKLLTESFQRVNVPVYISGCSAPVYEMMSKCDLTEGKKRSFKIFPTTHDAVQSARSIFFQNDIMTEKPISD